MPARWLLSAVLAIATALGVEPQIVRDTRPPLHSGVDLVMVTITVLDGSGRLITGLDQDEFTVFEDGERQPISVFINTRVPVGLGVLLDVSDSMFGQRILDARAAVERFLFTLLAPEDQYFLVAFNHAPRLLTRWTAAPDVVREALDGIRPSGGTAIYDAVLSAMPLMQKRSQERAALLIISDGADTASDATLRDVRSALLRSEAFVYAIAIDSTKRVAINTRVNPTALGEITNQSGGRTEVVTSTEELSAATGRIAEELNSQYVLGYASPKRLDGQFHSIRVTMRDGNYHARARNGYMAIRRGSLNQ